MPRIGVQEQIAATFDGIRDLVLTKNDRYKNSALDPVRIFSLEPNDVGIRVRLDDKLSRIQRTDSLRKNDVADLIGYLVLLCVSEGWTDFSDLVD